MKDFGTNETNILVQTNYVNINVIKINLDNQSYLSQLYENNTCFFNIPLVHAKKSKK